jgi:hypothetical protein
MRLDDIVQYIDTNLNLLTTFIVSATNSTTGTATVSAVIASAGSSQFGGGSALMPAEGNIYRAAYLSASAINPAATGADNVLAVYSLPANSFDAAGRGVSIMAQGKLGATTNAKDVKIIFNPSTAVVGSTVGSGGTTVADTGSSTASGVGWQLSTEVFKVGAAGSNTQYAQESAVVIGTTHGGMGVPLYPTATESAAILVAITGNATTATSDIALNFVQINGTN